MEEEAHPRRDDRLPKTPLPSSWVDRGCLRLTPPFGVEWDGGEADDSRRATRFAREALALRGHDPVDTGHLLLGLAREPEDGAARSLADMGANCEQVWRRVSGVRGTAE